MVSLLECMERYAEARRLLAPSRVRLPDDPRRLREWSLAMALTGTMNAIDRGLLPDVDSFTIHASGSYADGDYQRLPAQWITTVDDAEQMLDAVVGESVAV